MLDSKLWVLQFLPTIPQSGIGIPQKIGECVEQENWIEKVTKMDIKKRKNWETVRVKQGRKGQKREREKLVKIIKDRQTVVSID